MLAVRRHTFSDACLLQPRDPFRRHHTVEATKVAGGSSGKADDLLADWATPKCLALLSFKTHAELAKKHDGDKIWGHRKAYCLTFSFKHRILTRGFCHRLMSRQNLRPHQPKSLPSWTGSFLVASNPTKSQEPQSILVK